MKGVRAFQEADLVAVANLYESTYRSGNPVAAAGLSKALAGLFLEAPTVDEEIPSLVFEESDGSISSFLGTYVRRLRHGDRMVRAAFSGQLVRHPEGPTKIAGLMVLRQFLNGPQDLSMTDGANEAVGHIWTRLGGQLSPLRSMHWTRLLSPGRYAAARILGRGSISRMLGPVLGMGDPLTIRLFGRKRSISKPTTTEELTPELYLEYFPGFAVDWKLRPDLEPLTLQWLFGQLGAIRSRGNFHARIVREGGAALGWFLYFLIPGDVGHVIQIVARKNTVDTVFDTMVQHAWDNGATAVRGRVESHLLLPISRHCCPIRLEPPFCLIHTRDEQIRAAVQEGNALLTRMEGEWWVSVHIDDFDPA